ncbi:hypothetical protein, partial [Burkholderia ubonensis]|uniref:hypothetical protein n=1 Tax=Burkholderia ubonensis TaxID=101571 RepID=UPI001E38F20A
NAISFVARLVQFGPLSIETFHVEGLLKNGPQDIRILFFKNTSRRSAQFSPATIVHNHAEMVTLH